MKNKKRVLSILFTLVVIGIFTISPVVAKNPGKVESWRAQGGGVIYEVNNGHKVTFGFSVRANALGDVWGQLHAVDHQDKIVVHCSITTFPGLVGTIDPETGMGWMWGYCTVNGIDGYILELGFRDYRENPASDTDYIVLKIYDDSSNVIYEWYDELKSGNIIVEKP